eukprot:COSAG02_NODE_66048_length_256_cov_0.980892_1_plen_70_part_10
MLERALSGTTQLTIPQVVMAVCETVLISIGYLQVGATACEGEGAEAVMGPGPGHSGNGSAAPVRVGCLER